MNGQIQYDRNRALTSDPTPPPAPGDPSHLRTPVRFGRRRSDQAGQLELTRDRLTFHGALDLGVAWTEIASIECEGHEIVVSLVDSRRVLRFCCEEIEDAERGVALARRLASYQPAL